MAGKSKHPKGLHKRGDSWYCRIQFQGKRYKRSFGPVTLTIAKQKMAEFRARLYSGDYQEQKEKERRQITFFEYAKMYLEYYKMQWRDKSYRRAQTSMRFLSEEFGNKTLDEITSFDIERYKKKRKAGGAKPATINRDLNTLSNLYRQASKEGRVVENPANSSQVRRLKEPPGEWWILNDEEENELLNACDKIKEEIPVLKNRYSPVRIRLPPPERRQKACPFPAGFFQIGRDMKSDELSF